MKRPLPLIAALLSAVFFSGCLFSKKDAKPKESTAIAAGTDEVMRQRWVDKRVAELTAQGIAADAAKTQANEEFRVKYNFTAPPK